MDYTFNGQFGFPWNPTNPYNIQNQFNTQAAPNNFNTNGPPNNFSTNGQAAGNIQPFGNPALFGGPRFTPGLMPFGQNPQFGPNNWNYGFQTQNPVMGNFNGLQQQQQQQQQNALQSLVPGNPSNGQQIPCEISQIVKKENVNKDSDDSANIDKIALKVSSMLAKSLQSNANSSVCIPTENEDSDAGSTDTENELNSNRRAQSSFPSDIGLTDSSIDVSYRKQGNVP